jgi:CDP-6-deoxy-D-xylo-4-hexulose-3-dehydrase
MQAGGDMELVDCDDTWNAPHGDIIAPLLGNPIVPSFVAAVEDCCESFGAMTPDGQRCGTFGLISTFSFFYSHQLSAIEGGALLTDDDDLARMCRLLRNHGWEKGEAKTFGDEYRFVIAGYNLRPLEMHAAIARVQLLKADAGAAARRTNWLMFANMAEGLAVKMQAITSPDGFNPFCIAFTVPSSEIRETLAKALRADGIDCRPAVGGSFRLQPYGQHYEGPPTPNADALHHTGMMLGCAPFLIPEKIERAVAVMRRYL